MECPKCGKELDVDCKFCPECGSNLSGGSEGGSVAGSVFRFIATAFVTLVIIGAIIVFVKPVIEDMNVADGSIINLPPPGGECSMAHWKGVYQGKVHSNDAAIRDAAAETIQQFESAGDKESYVFKDQLQENYKDGVITPMEYSAIMNAIAIYRYVRDECSYSLGPPGAEAAQDDLTTLKRGIGKCDEKSVLLASMAESIGIDALLQPVSKENDVTEGMCESNPCECAERFDHMRVALYLPGFSKLQVYENKLHYASNEYCAYGDYVILEPTCIGSGAGDCPFAYGTPCYAEIFLDVT